MKVLVDTSIWSLALRRRRNTQFEASRVSALVELIQTNRAVLIGSIRQEILSGISETAHFKKLGNRLSPFPDLPIDADDYIEAARLHNTCRTNGVQGSHVDFLICAVAKRARLAIFTADKDFDQYVPWVGIALYALEKPR